jgi:LysM repeat protein|tara:strand:+ start:4606 stop:5340 length:735 start_codon:yes stop_codon:yes gene_type:complete
MKLGLQRYYCLCLLTGGLVVGSCTRAPDSSPEGKEPHYLAGRRLVQQHDWDGAERAFFKSLEINPRSALAHYELGIIYLSHKADPAAAIFHLNRYLTLNPKTANKSVVQGRIDAAKRDLAADIHGTPDAPSQSILNLRNKLNQLAAENQALHHHLKLNGITLGSQFELATNAPAPITLPQNTSNSPAPTPKPSATLRIHKVKSGENPSSIARKYVVSLSEFLAANPGLNPSKLQVGQELKIPPR